MKKINVVAGMACLAVVLGSCNQEELASQSSSELNLVDVAQTSGQLASGSSFRISGSSLDSVSSPPGGHGHPGKGGHHRGAPPLDGLNLLAPTNELLAIVEAESASDFRGLRLSKEGGATITNYNASGEVVTLPMPTEDGPMGCSFSGKQFPKMDSILSTIAKTVIDFGSGSTFRRDTVTVTRTGKIIITRAGTKPNITETTVFENYTVNGIGIQGTKTRVNTFNEATGSGLSTTTVSNGKIILADGTSTTWITDKTRASEIVVDAATKRPVSGTITTTVNTSVTTSDGTAIYSHVTSAPLVENVACNGRRPAPVSGVLKTVYRNNNLEVDFGGGSCDNRTVTVTLNGVTSTKTIGK